MYVSDTPHPILRHLPWVGINGENNRVFLQGRIYVIAAGI